MTRIASRRYAGQRRKSRPEADALLLGGLSGEVLAVADRGARRSLDQEVMAGREDVRGSEGYGKRYG